MNALTALAWHYTVGCYASAIVRDSRILPTRLGAPIQEKPVVWFSRHPRWEPTASKGYTDPETGIRRTATLEEMERLTGGLYRFGVEANRLLHWSKLREAARIDRNEARALAKAAYSVGADLKLTRPADSKLTRG